MILTKAAESEPAHIFHHRSLDLSFIVLAPPQNIKQKRAFSSILRATLLMRKKGRSRAWPALLTVFGRFRLPKNLWRARLSPLGWGAGAKVQFGVDNVCDWGCFLGQEEHGSFLFLLKSFLFSQHQQILSKTFPRLTQSGEGWCLRFVGAAQSVVQTKKIVRGRNNIREPKLPLALSSARGTRNGRSRASAE